MNDFSANPSGPDPIAQIDTSAAQSCLARFGEAFNAGDLAAMDAELHFPHTLLSGGQRLEWNSPGQLSEALFDTLRATGWARTQSESITPVLASKDKVHFVVVYTRRNAADEVICTYRNLWIVVRSAGRWGITLRSY